MAVSQMTGIRKKVKRSKLPSREEILERAKTLRAQWSGVDPERIVELENEIDGTEASYELHQQVFGKYLDTSQCSAKRIVATGS